MPKTQEQLQRFRDIVSSQPDDQRKQFIKNFGELSEKKKDMAISRVLSQSPAERGRVQEANIIGQEGATPPITGLAQQPGFIKKAK